MTPVGDTLSYTTQKQHKAELELPPAVAALLLRDEYYDNDDDNDNDNDDDDDEDGCDYDDDYRLQYLGRLRSGTAVCDRSEWRRRDGDDDDRGRRRRREYRQQLSVTRLRAGPPSDG